MSRPASCSAGWSVPEGRCPAGASPKEVAARAGHTSVSFVLDRYGHLFPESDAALRERLDVLFRSATEHRRNTAG
jgi:hypothetical protein